MAESPPAPGFDRIVDSDRFSNAMERALAHGEERAIVLIDLQGPEDAVVAAAEARILRTIRPSDLVGRLGRDRFAVLATTNGGFAQAKGLAIRLAQRLGEPFNVGGKDVLVDAQIGVAVGQGEADTAAKVLVRAEQSFDSLR